MGTLRRLSPDGTDAGVRRRERRRETREEEREAGTRLKSRLSEERQGWECAQTWEQGFEEGGR